MYIRLFSPFCYKHHIDKKFLYTYLCLLAWLFLYKSGIVDPKQYTLLWTLLVSWPNPHAQSQFLVTRILTMAFIFCIWWCPGSCWLWKDCPPLSGFSSVQSLSHVQLFATPWTAAYRASLSITNSQSLLKFMSIKLVILSNHLILCHPLFLLPSIFPSIRVFSSQSALDISMAKVRKLQLLVLVLPMNIQGDFL